MASRPTLYPPLPTSEPPPTADLPTSEPPSPTDLQQVPLPVSGDEESDSDADLFPPERHQVSMATPGQPTVTELGRQSHTEARGSTGPRAELSPYKTGPIGATTG